MKDSYCGIEVPRDGSAIEYAAAAQGNTPPFANNAQDGAPVKTVASDQ